MGLKYYVKIFFFFFTPFKSQIYTFVRSTIKFYETDKIVWNSTRRKGLNIA